MATTGGGGGTTGMSNTIGGHEAIAIWAKFCGELYRCARTMDAATVLRHKLDKRCERLSNATPIRPDGTRDRFTDHVATRMHAMYSELTDLVSACRTQLMQCGETLSLLGAIIEADGAAGVQTHLGYHQHRSSSTEPSRKKKKLLNQTSTSGHQNLDNSSTNIERRASSAAQASALAAGGPNTVSSGVDDAIGNGIGGSLKLRPPIPLLHSIVVPVDKTTYRYGRGIEVPLASEDKDRLAVASKSVRELMAVDKVRENAYVVVYSEKNYALASVKTVLGGGNYLVRDEYTDNEKQAPWRLHRRDFAVLPQEMTTAAEFPVGAKVFALFPTSTCFFRAQVVRGFMENRSRHAVSVDKKGRVVGDPQYWLVFEDDEEGVREVSAVFVLPEGACEGLPAVGT